MWVIVNLPTTVGSKSTKTALGTCLPAPVSLKKVLKESSPPPIVLSEGIWPSGWMPCSRQYNSQHALPICTPACPMCTLIHSRCPMPCHVYYNCKTSSIFIRELSTMFAEFFLWRSPTIRIFSCIVSNAQLVNAVLLLTSPYSDALLHHKLLEHNSQVIW